MQAISLQALWPSYLRRTTPELRALSERTDVVGVKHFPESEPITNFGLCISDLRRSVSNSTQSTS
jgi:hypothetical protein